MKAFRVRHGETIWNLQGREMGHLDSGLTLRGIEQARALADRLVECGVSTVYSSDLGRAVETAEIIATRCSAAVRVDARLRERHMGIFEGLTIEEICERYPEEHFAYRRDPDYVIPGGESARHRTERSVAAMTGIAEAHAAEDVVVVSHAGLLMGFFEHVIGIEPGHGRRFKRHHASFSAFEYVDGRWVGNVERHEPSGEHRSGRRGQAGRNVADNGLTPRWSRRRGPDAGAPPLKPNVGRIENRNRTTSD